MNKERYRQHRATMTVVSFCLVISLINLFALTIMMPSHMYTENGYWLIALSSISIIFIWLMFVMISRYVIYNRKGLFELTVIPFSLFIASIVTYLNLHVLWSYRIF